MNNFSISNTNTLNSYAQNVVRHLRNDDNKRAFENFTMLIKEGEACPGYTRTILTKAKFDNAKYLSNMVANEEIELAQAFKINKQTILKLAQFWNYIKGSEIDTNFKSAFAKFYPKTAQHRLAIEPFLEESSNQIVRSSNNKFSKKLLFFFLKAF